MTGTNKTKLAILSGTLLSQILWYTKKKKKKRYIETDQMVQKKMLICQTDNFSRHNKW